MGKNRGAVNIKCPACGNTIVTKYKDEKVKGRLLHKCSKCKRYWNVDYTTKIIEWQKGKPDNTAHKIFKLNMATGRCKPYYYGITKKALLRREGA